MEKIVIVRYKEIALKGENKPFFERTLINNIRSALLQGSFSEIKRLHGRIIIEGITQDFRIEPLLNIFGIHSVSLGIKTPLNIDIIKNEALSLFENVLKKSPQSKSFKVVTKRANKKFPYTSMELDREVGELLLKKHPEINVKMSNYDIEVGIEIHYQNAFLFTETLKGLGGLPVGVSGKTLLLLSGGIDSPVAGWLTMKRGCNISTIYYHSFPFTGEKSKEKVIELSRFLKKYQNEMTLFVIPFTKIQEEIRKNCSKELIVILYRRMMYRIAEKVANLIGAKALVTGENIGQVASQTLDNIYCIEKSINLTVIRPLITYDKSEIIDLARKLGTFEISSLPYEDCCTLFIPHHPKTNAKIEIVEAEEKLLDIENLVNEAINNKEVIEV